MIGALPIIERLNGVGFAFVEDVIKYAGLTQAPAASPALFVVPEAERAQPNRTNGPHDQLIDAEFGIILIIRTSASRAATRNELEGSVQAIMDALKGWSHPQACRASDYVGGNLIDATDGIVAWKLTFTAPYRERTQ